jgi:hypothetical protein
MFDDDALSLGAAMLLLACPVNVLC